MKYTHDRHFNIVTINEENMSKEDFTTYSSYRPIWDTIKEAEKNIDSCKPQFHRI